MRKILLVIVAALTVLVPLTSPALGNQAPKHRVAIYAPYKVVVGQVLRVGGSVHHPVAGQQVVLQLKSRKGAPWKSVDRAEIDSFGAFQLRDKVMRHGTGKLLVRVVRPKTSSSFRETSFPLKVGVKSWNGKVRATLLWSGDEDLDVQVIEPGGHVTSGSRPGPSPSGGALSDGSDRGCGSATVDGSSYEKISWRGKAKAPKGVYKLRVVNVGDCGAAAPTEWRLVLRVNGVRILWIPRYGEGDSEVFRFGGKSRW